MMEDSSESEKLEIKPETLRYLNITRKWTMFLSILGFIGLGTFLISGLITGVFLSVFDTAHTSLPEWLLIALFIAVAIIAFFPLLFIFRFSKHMAHAVKAHDQQELHRAFRNLKSFYVYTGILFILTLAIYLVVFIVAGASVSFFK
jgi:hypothetical protein